MNKNLKETFILIVVVLVLMATIAINFVAVMKYEILEKTYETVKNQYEIELEQREYELQVLKDHNLRLEEMIKEKSVITDKE